MNTALKEILWKQFGASIDMLDNAIRMCPDELWDTPAQFWYNAYHVMFYLDYYLDTQPDSFAPPAPFTLSEFDPSGALPERVYTQAELTNYLAFCKQKCHHLIAGLNDETIMERWANPYRDYNRLEILLYNMRHVQHHTGQLNMLLRQGMNDAPRWVSQTKEDL